MDYFTFNTYAENMKAAEYFLLMAGEHVLGQRWNLVAAVAFSAFSIEAFINHVGEQRVQNWKEWDSSSRPNSIQKIERLHVKLDVSLKSKFTELFQLRDMIAHRGTVTVLKNVRNPQNNLKGAMGNLSSEFEARTTLSKVTALVKDAKDIIKYINSSTISLDKHKLWSIGNGVLKTSQIK